MYKSQIPPSIPVIDNSNYRNFIDPYVDGVKVGRGLVPRDYSKVPRGSGKYTAQFKFPSMSEREQKELIEERERKGATLRERAKRGGVKVKNQKQTPLCWAFACTSAVEVVRAVQKQKYVSLSPASAAALITGYQYRGGYGLEAMEFMSEYGLVPSEYWDDTSFNRRLDNERTRAEREKFKASEWWELEEYNLNQLTTALLNDFPVAIGLSWWGHEVLLLDPVILSNGSIGYYFQNSWSENWGENGFGILTPEKSRGDMMAPRSVIVI